MSNLRLRLAKALCAAIGTACLACAPAARGGAKDLSVPDEILVELASASALAPLVAKYPLAVIDQFGSRPIYRLRVVGALDVKTAIDALRAEITVVAADPNFIHASPEARKNVVWAIGRPDDYLAQWAPQAIGLPEAQLASTGAGVRVAVVDTGVERTHPALAGRLLPGFDFVDLDTDPSETGGPGDAGFGHGTHVAGIVALVAPSASIMPIRALDAHGEGNAWVLAEAMLRAVDPDGDPGTDDGAHVINVSLGSLGRTRILDTIATLVSCSLAAADAPGADFVDAGYDEDRLRCSRSRGAVVVAAAGNGGNAAERQYPAAERAYGLIPVAASSADGRLARFSNYGSWVSLAAPGEGITSAFPGGGYATWSGTSMAAPFVAGAAALLRSAEPGLASVDVVNRLQRFGRTLCSARQLQLDIAAALASRVPSSPTCPK